MDTLPVFEQIHVADYLRSPSTWRKKSPLAITRWRGQKFRAAHNPRLVARSSIIILLGSSYRTNNSTCPDTESTADTYTHTHIFCFSEQ